MSNLLPAGLTGLPRVYLVGLAGGEFLEKNRGRQWLRVMNLGPNDCRIEFSAMPATLARVIPAGGEIEFLSPPGDSVWLQANTAATNVQIWTT